MIHTNNVDVDWSAPDGRLEPRAVRSYYSLAEAPDLTPSRRSSPDPIFEIQFGINWKAIFFNNSEKESFSCLLEARRLQVKSWKDNALLASRAKA